jgi:hypothetical protein
MWLISLSRLDRWSFASFVHALSKRFKAVVHLLYISFHLFPWPEPAPKPTDDSTVLAVKGEGLGSFATSDVDPTLGCRFSFRFLLLLIR